MSIDLHVTGFREADEKFKKMKDLWIACEEAGVPIPKEVLEFFDHESPREQEGMEVKLGDALVETGGRYWSGYEIDITKIPKDLKIIRAYLS